MRMRVPATVQRNGSPPGTVKETGSRQSEAKPSRRAARKRSSGRAMTPAVALSFTCVPAGSMLMLAPQSWKTDSYDNLGVILPLDNEGVNLETGPANGIEGDGLGATQERGTSNRRQQGR